MNIQVVSSLGFIINRVTLSCLIDIFWYAFDIGIFLENGLLGHRVFICLNLVDIAKLPKLLYYTHMYYIHI